MRGLLSRAATVTPAGNFSRSAIRHFFNVGEMMGPILTTIHNLRFYQRLMSEIRRRIEKGEMAKWGNEQLGRMSAWNGQTEEG